MAADTTELDEEPAATDEVSAAAGSSHAAPPAPTLTGDAMRAALCALLVGSCVASPESIAIVAPFVPALVAIRLLRARAGARRFLALATVASLATVVFVAATQASLAFGLATATLLVPLLGLLHAQAALRDPAAAPSSDGGTTGGIDWPEPRLASGMPITVGGWMLAVLLTATIAVPYLDGPEQVGRDSVDGAFSAYTRECAEGGILEAQEATCETMLARRDAARDLVDERAAELLAAFLAIFAWGAALTAHPIVVARTWRASTRVRPPWRLRELEVHWAAAYLTAAGIGAWLLAPGDTAIELAVRCAALFVGIVGGLLIVTQGTGLVAWILTRWKTPTWYRVLLAIGGLLFWPATMTLLFVFGVADMAAHPRRRAASAAPPS